MKFTKRVRHRFIGLEITFTRSITQNACLSDLISNIKKLARAIPGCIKNLIHQVGEIRFKVSVDLIDAKHGVCNEEKGVKRNPCLHTRESFAMN